MSTIQQYTNSLRDAPANAQTTHRTVVRLTQTEYLKIEEQVRSGLSQYRGNEPGALGAVVGAEMVMRILRAGFTNA